jgi:ATP-binding cassette subfamily B protein
VTGRGGAGRLARGPFGGGEPPPPMPPERRRRTFARIVAFFGPYRLQVGVVVGAILVTSLLGVVNPILLKLLTDEVIIGRDYTNLALFVGLMIATPIVSGLIGVGQTYLNNVIGQSVMQDLRNALYAHLQRLPLRFFTETRTGEIQSRLANDVGGVQAVVTDTATSVASNVAVVASSLVAMVVIDWRLTLLSVGMLPFFLYLTQRVGRVRRAVSTETQEALADMTSATQETLSVSGVLLTKTFGQQATATDRFRTLNRRLAALQLRRAMVGRWFFMIIGTIFSIIPAFVYWLAAVLAMNGDPSAPTAGDIVAFTTLQSRLFFPLGQLLNVQVEIAGSLALFDRIFEYLDLDPEIVDAPDALTLEPAAMRGRVRLHRVWFRYPTATVPSERALEAVAGGGHTHATKSTPDEALADAVVEPIAEEALETGLAGAVADLVEPAERPVAATSGPPAELAGVGGSSVRPAGDEKLAPAPSGVADPPGSATPLFAPPAAFALEEISFEAEPGQLLALVGPSGSGKTTTTYLVPRLYDVDSGSVEIDGLDVRRIALASLGRAIGVVTQETYLFHASIRDNLLYARPEATEVELETAARAAAIHERVLELPAGYETIVGERGYKLSGGEKQRIAIARVLLKDPRILILDEATSALDTVSERLIQAALERLMEGRTTIAIAHRLSTILRADQILVYDRGRIVERGRHEELLAVGGLYARLYHEQFEAPLGAAEGAAGAQAEAPEGPAEPSTG